MPGGGGADAQGKGPTLAGGRQTRRTDRYRDGSGSTPLPLRAAGVNQIGTMAVDVLLKTVPVTAVMSSPVLSVESGDELVDAARVMLEDKVGSLPVVEGGRVVGIITETDLLREICRADQSGFRRVAGIVVS